MGAHEIEFDDSGMPIIPQYLEAVHKRALLSDQGGKQEKFTAVFLQQENKRLWDFYLSLRNVVDYCIKELHKHHLGQPSQLQEAKRIILQYQAEISRLRGKLQEIQQFEDNEISLFEQWKKEDDRLRHARLSGSIRKKEGDRYSIDKHHLKVTKKAKVICLHAAETLRKTYAVLERINRSFDQETFSQEELNLLYSGFNELLKEMSNQIHWLKALEEFELKNIALWGEQLKLDFMVEKTLHESGTFIN